MLQIDAVLVVALYAAIFWQQSRTTMKESHDYYETRKNRLLCSFPPWAFGVIWTLLYTFKLLSGYFFLYSGSAFFTDPVHQGLFIGTFVVYLLEIVFNKWWSVVFFDMERPGWALVIVIAMIVLVGLYIGFLCGSVGIWWHVYLILPYLAWLLVAGFWNAQWIMSDEKSNGKKTEDPQSLNSPIIVDLEKQQEHHVRRNTNVVPGKPALKIPNKYQINL
jgi:tryptophan-rich sensory protein